MAKETIIGKTGKVSGIESLPVEICYGAKSDIFYINENMDLNQILYMASESLGIPKPSFWLRRRFVAHVTTSGGTETMWVKEIIPLGVSKIEFVRESGRKG